jgi:adenosylmethionine-8-amino-7-oxononanoate aminotransferase
MSSLWFPYAQMQTMPPPFKVARAEGVKLYLENNRELIDSISSWWCVIHGYNNKEINAAIYEQMQKFSHVMLGGLTHEPAEKLSKELVRIAPKGLNHVFFADSGSVGMEVAMKMAAQFWRNNGVKGKHKFAALYRGYHGDTSGVMSIGDPEEGMHHLFKGFLPQQFFIHPSLPEMEKLFKEHSGEIAAFACEPLLQGAGGFNFYQPEFLKGARELCDKHDVLWIADEVATGFGRTGTMFACEASGAVPDIMVLGKALTAGYMGLSATLASDKVYNSFLGESSEKAFMHGPTFMGNALACSAALASLKIFERENYLAKIARINEILKEELLGFEARGVKETRVLGACGVIETIAGAAPRGCPCDIHNIQQFAAERGVWLRPFLNVAYTMPPYIISEEELRKVCGAMKDFFSTCYSRS